MRTIGLYIHIPFCKSKCPYCDFYSLKADAPTMQTYTDAVCRSLTAWKDETGARADTLYFGGGTPSLLGAERLAAIVRCAAQFGDFSEITVECNPSCVEDGFFSRLAAVGVNRISIGLQSAVDAERRALGRISDRAAAETCIRAAQAAGITNISLDVMLGIPHQTAESLNETIRFCTDAGAAHISAYMLKLEEGTYFYQHKDALRLPDDDAAADLYLMLCDAAETRGFHQYEISNFAKPGQESRHNLKYWRCEEYLGVGPAAHSFLNGERFYYPRDLNAFLRGEKPVPDGAGGDLAEYLMLRLRLREGISFAALAQAFPRAEIAPLREKCTEIAQAGYAELSDSGFHLTPRGFLISNTLIARLL